MEEYIEFQNGQKMPIVGLGMWLATDETELEMALDEALEVGYRHFDTAFIYTNEGVFGRVMKRWFEAEKVTREELFIVTKLPVHGMHKDRVEMFMNKSLSALQLDYVDLYLIHMPFGTEFVEENQPFPIKDGKLLIDKTTDLEAVWKAMEDQVDAGKTKAIGVSNYSPEQIERTMSIARIQPQNVQVEMNLQFQQRDLRGVCKKYNITVTAYSPLGSPGSKVVYEQMGVKKQLPNILTHPVVLEVAAKHRKSGGQILLRFLAQSGVVVIPKSVNPKRLKQNIQIFDFELNSDEMRLLRRLDKGEDGRVATFDVFPGIDEHPEYPFRRESAINSDI